MQLGPKPKAAILVGAAKGPTFAPDLSAAAQKRLEKLGVEVCLGHAVEKIDDRASMDADFKKRPASEILLAHLMEGIGIALDFKGDRMFLTDLVTPLEWGLRAPITTRLGGNCWALPRLGESESNEEKQADSKHKTSDTRAWLSGGTTLVLCIDPRVSYLLAMQSLLASRRPGVSQATTPRSGLVQHADAANRRQAPRFTVMVSLNLNIAFHAHGPAVAGRSASGVLARGSRPPFRLWSWGGNLAHPFVGPSRE